MTASELAILGGAPLRTRPFSVEPMIDAEEERLTKHSARAAMGRERRHRTFGDTLNWGRSR